jgi:hypothetical protein
MNHFYNILVPTIAVIIIIAIYKLFYNTSNTISSEDKQYLNKFDIYGDFLFQMYGVISLIKSIYADFNNFEEFHTFFNEIKQLLQYNDGDSIIIKSGQVDFTTKLIQKNYKRKQTYLEVLYPINDQYYILFDRIIKYLDLSDYKTSEHPVKHDKNNQLITASKLSTANKDLLQHMSSGELLSEFTNALGYSFVLQHFVYKYNSFDMGLAVIKEYNHLFMTKYGEGIFIWKNDNFSFEDNNDNYVFQDKDWIYLYNTVVEKYKKFVGNTPSAGNVVLKSICEKSKTKCDLVDVIATIVDTLIHEGAIVKYNWFNNVFLLPNKKMSVVFKHKQYFYGSGYNYGF